MLRATIITFAVILLVNSAAAGGISAYSSSTCTGDMAGCYNVPEEACCAFPPDYQWTTGYQKTLTPLTSHGAGTTKSHVYRALSSVPASKDADCIRVHDGKASLHAMTSGTNIPIRSHARRRSLNKGTRATCAQPNVIGFRTQDNALHRHDISGIGFKKAERLLKEKDYKALFVFPKVEGHTGY